MIACTTGEGEEGIQVHAEFQDIQCWQGFHILHTIFAIVITIVFVIMAIIVALTYFESRITSNDPTARSDPRADVCFIGNKIVLQVSFAFLPESYQWPMVIMIFVGGLCIFYFYQYEDPYYNETVSKMFKILSAYYLWTSTLLFISKSLQTTSFTGGLVCWIVGLPFIIVIMLSTSKGNIKTLTKSQIKFETPDELIDHLRYVLQLVEKQKDNDKSSYLYLAGYIEKHKDVCMEDDCPLKVTRKKRQVNNIDKEYVKEHSEMSFNESVNKLY